MNRHFCFSRLVDSRRRRQSTTVRKTRDGTTERTHAERTPSPPESTTTRGHPARPRHLSLTPGVRPVVPGVEVRRLLGVTGPGVEDVRRRQREVEALVRLPAVAVPLRRPSHGALPKSVKQKCGKFVSKRVFFQFVNESTKYDNVKTNKKKKLL